MPASCTACGHASTTVDPFYYIWDGQRFSLRRCDACTHQFVWPKVTPEQQAHIYRDAYFCAGGDWAVDHFGGRSYEDAEADLVAEAAGVLPWLTPHRGRLLDIGCAGGTFLAEARKAGFDVAGLEINEAMAKSARARYGLDVTCAPIECAEIEGLFDAVTLMDVLEHVPEPLEALRRIHGWLRPGGVLFIRGPLVTGLVARLKDAARRMVGPEKQLPGYPLDANMFNRRSIEACLRSAGFAPHRWWVTTGLAHVRARRQAPSGCTGRSPRPGP